MTLDPDEVMVLTREQARKVLVDFVKEFAIDPHDAGEIYNRVPSEGIDQETLGDYLDGQGYPELCQRVYDLEVPA